MEVHFYKIIEETGALHYMAAKSVASVKSYLNELSIQASKLEEITEEEAQKAPHFREFSQTYGLCSDGTHSLGVVRKDQHLAFT